MKKKKSKPKAVKKSKPKKAVKARVKVKAKSKAKSGKPAKSKRSKKKAAKRQAPPKPGVIAPPNSILLGYVEDYFAKIGVVALTLVHAVSGGSSIHILGHTTNFEQILESMQIDHEPVTDAKAKDGVGIKVTARCRRGDHVYLIP